MCVAYHIVLEERSVYLQVLKYVALSERETN